MLFLFVIMVFALSSHSSSLEIKTKGGEVVVGDLLMETRGRIFVKSGDERIRLFKKSIKSINGESEDIFPLSDTLLLSNPHDLTLINKSSYSVIVKVRCAESRAVVVELSLADGESGLVGLPSGRFYEVISYDAGRFYSRGAPFELYSRPGSFERLELTIEQRLDETHRQSIENEFHR